MGIPKADLTPSAVFLVRATGGGKSLVRDTVAAANGGITLSISPLLSLGADQESNLNLGVRDGGGAIAAYHLDEFSHHKENQRAIVKEVLATDDDKRKTIVLFASPQAVAKNDVWREMIHEIIKRRMLRLVCVDEVHLFCSFAFSFRSEIYSLKECLFSKLLAPDSPAALGTATVCPILVMTATATKETVEQFTLLTGVKVDTSLNVFWPTGPEMCRRELNLFVEYTTSPMAQVKKQACDLMSVNDSSKLIVYSNSRYSSEKYHASIVTWLNETGYHGDAVLINGSFTKEEKFHRSRLFGITDEAQTMVLPSHTQACASSPHVNPSATNGDSTSQLPNNPYSSQSGEIAVPDGIGEHDAAFDEYHARVLVATIDAVAAGLNVKTVRQVVQTEFPSSFSNLFQAAGRAARYPGALAADNKYTNYISLEGYTYLFRRLYLPQEEATSDGGMPKDLTKLVSPDMYRSQQLKELHQVVRLLVLPTECLHIAFEKLSGNPFDSVPPDSEFLPPCRTDCSYCRGEYSGANGMFPLISKKGISSLLTKLFIGGVDANGQRVPSLSDRTVPDGIVKAIQDFPGSRKLLFGGKTTSEKPPEPIKVKKVLLLLLAAQILAFAIEYGKEDEAKKNPIVVIQLNVGDEGPYLYCTLGTTQRTEHQIERSHLSTLGFS